MFVFLMIRRPPRSTRTDTLFPTRRSSDLRRSDPHMGGAKPDGCLEIAGHAHRQPIEPVFAGKLGEQRKERRSEEHTSELQSLMRISSAVFCLKKKTQPEQQSKHLSH